jgi:hypothetical protein
VLHHVDRAIEQLFRVRGLVDESVDISFDAPDRNWGAARVRPTINVFLWEIVRNPALQRATLEQWAEPGEPVRRRLANPVVDLHYLVTAWATEQRDEHEILGVLLRTVLASNVLPDDVLPEPLRATRCTIGLAPHDKRVPGDFWSALDGRLKPGLQLEVSLPIEVFAWVEAAPAVEVVAGAVGPLREAPPAQAGPSDAPMVRRFRSSGAVVMEGRAERAGLPQE